jgi:hypothetical protein
MAPKETKQAENNGGKAPEKEGRFRPFKSWAKKIKDRGRTTENKLGLKSANERKSHPADGKDDAEGARAKTFGHEQNTAKGQGIDQNMPHSANHSPEKNLSNDKSSSVAISIQLWDTAYDKLKDESKDLALGYEKILSFEMGQSGIFSGQTGRSRLK